MDVHLEGHVALVTGANHGIGAATARALAASGAGVLATYLRTTEEPDAGIPTAYRDQRAGDAEDLAAAIRNVGGHAMAYEADLTDPNSIPALFDLAEQRLGPVDILVNNASAWHADTFSPRAVDRLGRRLQSVSAAGFDSQFAVDARSAALLIAEFARRLAARNGSWGRIIGLTSGGPDGFPEEVSYGAAKAAQENYTMSAAIELAPFGVTANILYPPVTDTGWITDEVRKTVAGRPEFFGIAQPEEVADVIVFLAGDAAQRITGNVIRMR